MANRVSCEIQDKVYCPPYNSCVENCSTECRQDLKYNKEFTNGHECVASCGSGQAPSHYPPGRPGYKDSDGNYILNCLHKDMPMSGGSPGCPSYANFRCFDPYAMDGNEPLCLHSCAECPGRHEILNNYVWTGTGSSSSGAGDNVCTKKEDTCHPSGRTPYYCPGERTNNNGPGCVANCFHECQGYSESTDGTLTLPRWGTSKICVAPSAILEGTPSPEYCQRNGELYCPSNDGGFCVEECSANCLDYPLTVVYSNNPYDIDNTSGMISMCGNQWDQNNFNIATIDERDYECNLPGLSNVLNTYCPNTASWIGDEHTKFPYATTHDSDCCKYMEYERQCQPFGLGKYASNFSWMGLDGPAKDEIINDINLLHKSLEGACGGH
tara:strand:- start:2728 stop:3873 length:1146 start_codon:yes stop_codon:yes gene_type:complete